MPVDCCLGCRGSAALRARAAQTALDIALLLCSLHRSTCCGVGCGSIREVAGPAEPYPMLQGSGRAANRPPVYPLCSCLLCLTDASDGCHRLTAGAAAGCVACTQVDYLAAAACTTGGCPCWAHDSVAGRTCAACNVHKQRSGPTQRVGRRRGLVDTDSSILVVVVVVRTRVGARASSRLSCRAWGGTCAPRAFWNLPHVDNSVWCCGAQSHHVYLHALVVVAVMAMLLLLPPLCTCILCWETSRGGHHHEGTVTCMRRAQGVRWATPAPLLIPSRVCCVQGAVWVTHYMPLCEGRS